MSTPVTSRGGTPLPPETARAESPGETLASVEGASAETTTMRGRAARGSLYTIGGHAAVSVLRFVSNLILTRLLFPEHFGVMALVNIVLIGLHLFADIGIGPNIIQSQRGEDPVFLRTAWTLQVIRGFVLTAVSALIAWPVALIYRMPELLWMLPVAGTTAVLEGFASVSLFTHNRSLRLGRIMAIDVAATTSSVITMVIVAYLTRSIVSLLVGGIVAALLRTVASHVLLKGIKHRFLWDREAFREIFTFGRWVFLSTAITFIAMQIDRITLGRFIPADQLGMYSVALMLAMMPRDVVGQLSQRVYYPIATASLRERNSERVRELRWRICTLLVVPVACTIGVAVPLVHFLYDERYHSAGILMAVLSIDTWVTILSSSYGAIALARGEPRYVTYGTGSKAILFAVLFYPVFTNFGVVGVAGLAGFSSVALYACTATGAHAVRTTRLGLDAVLTLAVVLLAAGAYLVHGAVEQATGSSLAGILLLAVVAVGVPGVLLATRRVRLLE